MRDYKPKSKDKIKAEVKKHLRDVKDSKKSIDNVVEDAEKVSKLYKQLRDTRVTIDSAIEIDKSMQDVFKTVRKYNDKLQGNLETKLKDTSKTAADLDARTKDAEKNAKKVRKTSRKITTSGAIADMSKAENAARKDAQFTNTERKHLEDCIKNTKATQQPQRAAIYALLPSVPNYQAESEIGRAIQQQKGDRLENQRQSVPVDGEDNIEIEKAVSGQKGKSKSEQIKNLEQALSDAELQKERMMGGMGERHKKSHTAEQKDNTNNPAYSPPSGNEYKRDKK